MSSINVNINLPLEIIAELQSIDVNKDSSASPATREVIKTVQALPFKVQLKAGGKRKASEAMDLDDEEEEEESVPVKKAKKTPKARGKPTQNAASNGNTPPRRSSRFIKTEQNSNLPFHRSGMQLFIKDLVGKTYSLDCMDREKTTIAELRRMAAEKIGLPTDMLRLVFAGKQLADYRVLRNGAEEDDEWTEDLTLRDYQIQKESTIHQVMRLRGS